MFIIGIAGGTGSGKTTVVRKIMQFLPADEVGVISQDAYYKDSSHIPIEERQQLNFDHPDSIEFPLLVEHLKILKSGKSVECPVYSYLTCSRLQETTHTKPKEVMIVEGILLLTNEHFRNLCNIKIFVDATADDRLLRVIQRDLEERERNIEEVIARYQETVKPMHDLFIEPTKRFADIIVPQGGNNHVAIDVLTSTIKSKLSKSGH